MRWRLVAALVGVVLVVLLVHDVPLAYYLRDVERDRLLTALERDAFTLAGYAEEALEGAGTDRAIDERVADYSERTGARVVITDRDGFAAFASDPDATVGRNYSTRPEIGEALAGLPVVGVRRSETLDQDLLYVAVPVRSGDAIVGAVRLTYDEREVDERVSRRVNGLIVVAAISIAVAFAVAIVVATTVSRPLRRLRDATNRFARGDLSARAESADGPAELRQLAESFNEMAERLETVVRDQRGFSANASHQLRTPLTALRLRLERAAELVHDDPDAAADRLEAAAIECDRLGRTVEGLLALARADAAGGSPVVVDVAAAVDARLEGWRPLAEERGARIVRVDPSGRGRRIEAVEHAVEHVVDNLVDNAIGVTPDGGTVEVELVDLDGRVELHVRDEGPGLDDEGLERAFEQFWRGEDAAAGGSGLGLAIVRQQVRASGGAVRLERRSSGGLDAVVSFRAASRPLAPPSGTVRRAGGTPAGTATGD